MTWNLALTLGIVESRELMTIVYSFNSLSLLRISELDTSIIRVTPCSEIFQRHQLPHLLSLIFFLRHSEETHHVKLHPCYLP